MHIFKIEIKRRSYIKIKWFNKIIIRNDNVIISIFLTVKLIAQALKNILLIAIILIFIITIILNGNATSFVITYLVVIKLIKNAFELVINWLEHLNA